MRYQTALYTETWYLVTGSNRRQPPCKDGTLPTELTRQNMERVGRVELRDLQLGRLLDAPCPVYPHLIETHSGPRIVGIGHPPTAIQCASIKCLATPTTGALNRTDYSVYVLFYLDRLASLPL